MSVDFKFNYGKLATVTMHRVKDISLTDCRDADDGFVSINFKDDEGAIQKAYVPTEQIAGLLDKLAALDPEKGDA